MRANSPPVGAGASNFKSAPPKLRLTSWPRQSPRRAVAPDTGKRTARCRICPFLRRAVTPFLPSQRQRETTAPRKHLFDQEELGSCEGGRSSALSTCADGSQVPGRRDTLDLVRELRLPPSQVSAVAPNQHTGGISGVLKRDKREHFGLFADESLCCFGSGRRSAWNDRSIMESWCAHLGVAMAQLVSIESNQFWSALTPQTDVSTAHGLATHAQPSQWMRRRSDPTNPFAEYFRVTPKGLLGQARGVYLT
jgi:hypothetical protein